MLWIGQGSHRSCLGPAWVERAVAALVAARAATIRHCAQAA